MHTNNQFSSSETNNPKGSKQKIFQLKEELNEGNLGINPKLEKLKVLRESYDIAKFRANELLQPHDKNLYIKVHGQRASKIYSALSTLIFVSLSNSKVEELEHYIMNSASQVPSSIFDLEEWSSIVKIAKDCREGDHSAQQEKLKLMRKNMQIFHQLAANPLRTTQMELKLLKSEVTNEVISAQRELAGNMNIIHQIIAEIQSTGSSSLLGENTEKLNHLIQEHNHNSLKSVSDKTKEDELKVENESLKSHNTLLQNNTLEQQALITTLQAQLQATVMKSDEVTIQNVLLTEKLRAQDSQLAEQAQQKQQLTEELRKQEVAVQELATATAAQEAQKPSTSTAELAKQAREYQDLFEKYSAAVGELERRDELIAALQEQMEKLKQASEAAHNDTSAASTAVPTTNPSNELLLGELDAVQSNYDALRASLESEISRKTELQQSLIAAEAAHASTREEAVLAKQEVESAKETIAQLRADLVEIERKMPESSTAPTSNSSARTVFQEHEGEASELKGVKISSGEEQDLVSLITAEAIHSASAAVAAAAARLVTSLSGEAAVVALDCDEESVQSLQSSLVESIVAHNEVLRSPHASSMVSASLSPRELAETSMKLTVSPSKPPREVEMEENADESGAITDEDEEEAVLSLIYAEAIHTASVAVSEAAARLIEAMSAERTKKDKELLELQSSLVDSLATHGEVLKSPAKGASCKVSAPTLAPAAPITSPMGRVHFRSGEDNVRKFDLNLPASAAVADVTIPDKSASTATAPAPLVSVGFDEIDKEKDTLLTAITAEAIRTASQAVSDAAARLVANLANVSASTNSTVSLASLLSLQVDLADSLDAQSAVLKSPQVASNSAKLSGLADTINTSSKLRSAESTSTKNAQSLGEDTTVQSEEQLLLSLISAEAIHIASTSVANAAAKLVALLTTDDPAALTSEETFQVQASLTDSLAAHSDAVSSPNMISASQLSFLATAVEGDVVPAVEKSDVSAVEGGVVSAVEECTSPVAPALVEEGKLSDLIPPSSKLNDGSEDEASKAASTRAAPTLRAVGGDTDVVLVQNQLRGFVARARVRRIRQEKEAARQGVLVATKGTVQGESGWYKTADEQLFYFCMDQGEYVLLSGPIDDELYEAACKLERPTESASLRRTTGKPSVLSVDRIGLRATRLQIDMLTADIATLETELEQLKQGTNNKNTNIEIDTTTGLQQSETNITSLSNAQKEIQALTAEIIECKEMIRRLETERRRSLLSRHASEIVKDKMVALTIPQVVALVHLTSMVRGFLARARVRRIKTSKLALEVGVLSAMPNTIQGESGWYMGPNRAIFYFVLKGGEWINIAGPMTEEEFDIMQLDRKQKQITYSTEVLTHCPLQLDANLVEREALLERDDYVAAPASSVDSTLGTTATILRIPSTDESIPPNINSIAERSVKNTGFSIKSEQKSMLSATSARVEAPAIDDAHEKAKTEE